MDLVYLLSGFNQVGKPVVPDCVIWELKGLSNKIPEASAGILLAERFEKISSAGNGDRCITDIAIELRAFVLTNDRNLVERLKHLGIRVLSIRGGKKIDFV